MRCAVINSTGLVVNVIEANPDIDRVPNHTLKVAPDEVIKGYMWIETKFIPSPQLLEQRKKREEEIYQEILKRALE